MKEEIVNRVAKSPLVTFDLESFYPKDELITLDIQEFLFEGILLREKEFRLQLEDFDFSAFQSKHVALTCSTEAILPAWTYILIASHLHPVALSVVKGDKETLLMSLYQKALEAHDFSQYAHKPIILKGCSKLPVPYNAYLLALKKLQPYAKSIMYGEACSAVPIYKSKKNSSS